jgi:membrane-bound serine protease (ClpP class)
MIIAFLFLIFGLFFIVLEFYLPGAIMATIGAIMLIASVLLFAATSESIFVDLLYLIAVLGLVALVIKYVLKIIPRASSRFNIYLKEDQEGYYASQFDKTAIGKVGIVVTDLKPGGYISIDGKKHQAISQSGYISSGEQVLVIGGREESLIVKSL